MRLNKYRRTKDVDDKLAWIESVPYRNTSFRAKENSYWTCKVAQWPGEGKPAKLWKSLSSILRRERDLNSAFFRNSQLMTFWNVWNRNFLTFEQALVGMPGRRSRSLSKHPSLGFELCRRMMFVGSSWPPKEVVFTWPDTDFNFQGGIDVLLPNLTVRCNAS